jgi:hypothetical protein
MARPDPDASRAVMLITGIQAAGKSTVAQLLAERLPRPVHVRGDAFRRMAVDGRAAIQGTKIQSRSWFRGGHGGKEVAGSIHAPGPGRWVWRQTVEGWRVHR